MTADPAAHRAAFAVVGSRMAAFLPGPHLSVTFLGRDVGDDPLDTHGAHAYHATSLVALVLETGHVVSASELRGLELRSFDDDTVRFVATGRGPHWGTAAWYCAAAPSDLDGADRFHAYCTARAPKGKAPWPACAVSLTCSGRWASPGRPTSRASIRPSSAGW